MIRIRTVLVATDFSEPSNAALQYGRELTRTFEATLHVLHVADSAFMSLSAEMYVPALPELQREIEEAAQRHIDTVLSEEDRTTLKAKGVIVTAVGKAEAIVGYAQEHAIDVIVIGTHGRGAIGHLLMGSVAERVVRTATCPVLTVHAPQREFVVPDTLVAVTRA